VALAAMTIEGSSNFQMCSERPVFCSGVLASGLV